MSCCLWHHIILSPLCLPLFLSHALLSSSSVQSSVSVSLGTLGFMLGNSKAFGSWESLVSICFFPQCLRAPIFYQASDKVSWNVVGFSFAWTCFVFIKALISITDVCPDPLCCRQFVRRRPKTLHRMKSVRKLYKQSARSVGFRSRRGMLYVFFLQLSPSCKSIHDTSLVPHHGAIAMLQDRRLVVAVWLAIDLEAATFVAKTHSIRFPALLVLHNHFH